MRGSDEERTQWWISLRENTAQSDKSWTVAFRLSVFLGCFGADRFYLGYSLLGFMKLLSFGGLGFWWLVDLVLIILGKMKDSEGGVIRSPFIR